jgi:hypothetical protein
MDGRAWFGQPIDRAFEAAVSRHQEGEGTAAPGGVRGSVQQTTTGAAEQSVRADTGRPRTDGQGTGGINTQPVREDERVELKRWSRTQDLNELDPSFRRLWANIESRDITMTL